MRNPILPFLALLSLAVATVAALRHDAPEPPTRPMAAPPPQPDYVPALRQRLHSHLGRPSELLIEGVRPSRMREHSGVLCGRAAWNGAGYMRFVAAERNVLIDGQSPDFDGAWQRICNGSPTMGVPPQTHAAP